MLYVKMWLFASLTRKSRRDLVLYILVCQNVKIEKSERKKDDVLQKALSVVRVADVSSPSQVIKIDNT